ncbi:MAG: TolC family protein [Nitrospirota bacterium]
MMRVLAVVCLLFLPAAVHAERGAGAPGSTDTYTLSEALEIALRDNPGIRASGADVAIADYGIDAARAEKMPKIDFFSNAVRYRYPAPVTPISGSPLEGAGFPEFDTTIYDLGAYLTLPLYRGGRLDRAVTIAEIDRAIAQDMFRMSRQDLVYNVTSVFYKIYQLEELLEANRASVRQLEAHQRDVALFFEAGTVPRIELLKTETELAHARQNVLAIENSLESAFTLLKALMGIEEMTRTISVVRETAVDEAYPPLEKGVERAFSQRPDYRAMLKRLRVAEEQIALARGRRLPFVSVSSEYAGRSGDELSFKENWNLALRLTMPLFDGGAIKADVGRRQKELERTREEQQSLRLAIIREVKDAYLAIENARKRIGVTEKALESAQENLRIERLKFEAGGGTSTDVIDARTTLLRAETDYYQALFDKRLAAAALMRAMGEERFAKPADKDRRPSEES